MRVKIEDEKENMRTVIHNMEGIIMEEENGLKEKKRPQRETEGGRRREK